MSFCLFRFLLVIRFNNTHLLHTIEVLCRWGSWPPCFTSPILIILYLLTSSKRYLNTSPEGQTDHIHRAWSLLKGYFDLESRDSYYEVGRSRPQRLFSVTLTKTNSTFSTFDLSWQQGPCWTVTSYFLTKVSLYPYCSSFSLSLSFVLPR